MPCLADILILAKSGRALAQSARRGGWRPWVIDAFGDADTRACAAGVAKVAMEGDGLSEPDVSKALDRRVRQGSLGGGSLGGGARAGVIYGSGVEAMPALLDRLAGRFEIIGNGADVVRTVKDPRAFFARLAAFGIAYPATRFTAPDNERCDRPRGISGDDWPARDWLVKRATGSGGEHVRRWNGESIDGPQHYFQRFVSGPAMSALFVADGCRARIIGYNTQWGASRASAFGYGFIYGGAINRARLSPPQRALVADHVSALAEAFGLRGLNSLDFVLHRGQPRVLEINPRPGATCELYEPEAPDGMLALHVRACDGDLLGERPMRARVHAHAIVYAQRRIRVPADMRWPRWCRDLPADGAAIPARAPVCSVVAEGDGMEPVRRLIEARCRAVWNALTPASRRAA
ncbi:MAG: ATP-grasp domain-containing protein [Gammaproteobacteria bacterium]